MDNSFLRSEIENDISVRQASLSNIKTMPTRYWFKDNDKATWLRCAFPIIYAEWEGFFVYSLSLYFRELNKLHLCLDDLHDSYFIRNTEKRFKQLKEYPKKDEHKYTFLKEMQNYFRNTNDIQLQTEINTASNLGFNVMNTILTHLNMTKIEDHINNDAYSLKDEMDKFLLDKRNGLVHGDPASTVETCHITKAITLVERLMDLIKDTILDGFKNEVYRKTQSFSSISTDD